MRKITFRNGICVTLASVMVMAAMTGCGQQEVAQETTIFEEAVALEAAPVIEEVSEELVESESNEEIYTDANGWRVKYDPEKFAVNQAGPMTSFVYMGECAGTNMIIATYTVENKAEAAVKELGAPYEDKAEYIKGTFPGTENVEGYWVYTAPDIEGSGSYMTAIARDYMDGALVFELYGHMGEDEFMDMEVSDALASIIDSISFPYEN